MVSRVRVLGAGVIGLIGLGLVLSAQSEPPDAAQTARSAYYHTRARLADDEAAFRVHRPAYSFWQHIFTIPDGAGPKLFENIASELLALQVCQ